MTFTRSQLTLGISFAVFGGAMVGFGFFLAAVFFHPPHHHDFGFEMRGKGVFTNPLLECEVAEGAIRSRKEDFTPELVSFIEDIKKSRVGLSETAVYYRDLNNGPVIGVGQNIEFLPASLLKVPIMMVYFHRAQSSPGYLDTQITYAKHSGAVSSSMNFPAPTEIKLGQSYTYAELIEHMIKYSDNEAMALLWENIPISEQIDLYKLVGVDSKILLDPNGSVSVKQYSIFFRVLFNSSYLTQEYSERALKLLSESVFDAGVRGGVPAEVPVAHKFGERQVNSYTRQLHDCGIVYYPEHPYLLCIMTRGSDADVLARTIRDISSFIYGTIDAEYDKRP